MMGDPLDDPDKVPPDGTTNNAAQQINSLQVGGTQTTETQGNMLQSDNFVKTPQTSGGGDDSRILQQNNLRANGNSSATLTNSGGNNFNMGSPNRWTFPANLNFPTKNAMTGGNIGNSTPIMQPDGTRNNLHGSDFVMDDYENVPSPGTGNAAVNLMGFQPVKNGIKRQRVSDLKNTQPDVSAFGSIGIDNNRFAILGQISIEQEISAGSQLGKRKSTAADKSEEKNNAGKSGKKSFCPPIMMYNVNVRKLVDQLNDKNVSFKIVNKGRNKTKLYFEDLPAHLEMMELLRSQGIESHSFTPPELKQVSVVLRGLYYGTDVAAIGSTLEALIPGTVGKVAKFKTPASVEKEYDTGLFLVTLLPGKKKDDLIRIKYLFHQTVTWESPRSRGKEIQCYRCQKWGHTARNCNRKMCCVKCDRDHAPGECSVEKGNGSVPVCVNCRKSGHTANFRGCSSFKDYKKDRKATLNSFFEKKAQQTENVKAAAVRNNVVPGKSYASNFYDGRTEGRRPAIIDKFLEIAEFFGEKTLETRIAQFLRVYKSMPKDEAKVEYGKLLQEVFDQYGP